MSQKEKVLLERRKTISQPEGRSKWQPRETGGGGGGGERKRGTSTKGGKSARER